MRVQPAISCMLGGKARMRKACVTSLHHEPNWEPSHEMHSAVVRKMQASHLSFGKMDPEKLEKAISNCKDGIKGSTMGDNFLQKIQVTSGALPHSDRAAQTVRQCKPIPSQALTLGSVPSFDSPVSPNIATSTSAAARNFREARLKRYCRS